MSRPKDNTKHSRLEANCLNVFSLALTDRERGGDYDWHAQANSKRSSQSLCVSAIGPLRHEAFGAVRNMLLARLVGGAFNTWQSNVIANWSVEIEKRDPDLLNENGGGTPSSLDALLTTPLVAVAVETKFASDAAAGFGGCGQYHTQGKTRKCVGFYGHGSDLVPRTQAAAAACRLTIADGRRSPRRYWELGQQFFRSKVFAEQTGFERCPFRDSNFQLMRNFLFAAAYAELHRKKYFGVLIVCSKQRDHRLREQLAEFRSEIVLPSYDQQVRLVYYEDWIEILTDSGAQVGRDLAKYLKERIESVIPRKT